MTDYCLKKDPSTVKLSTTNTNSISTPEVLNKIRNPLQGEVVELNKNVNKNPRDSVPFNCLLNIISQRY